METMHDIASLASSLAREGNLTNIGKVLAPRAKIRSISSFAGNAIYYFPVLTSSSVVPETSGMVSYSLERSYCSFMRAVLSMMPAMKVEGNQVNVEEYLKQFHQNIGIDSSYHSIRLNENACKPWTNLPNSILNEATTDSQNKARQLLSKASEFHKNHITTDRSCLHQEKTRKVIGQNILGEDVYEDADNSPCKIDKVNKLYQSSDYENKNSFQPSLINANIKFLLGKEERLIDVTIPIGIKTQLHVLDANKLSDRLVDTLVGRGVIHDLIRWSTGEMLSLKDIIFGVNKIKHNIHDENDEVNQWMNTIESRKRLSEISLPVLNKQAFLPNTSVIVSMSDVKAIESQYGLDLMNAQYARKLIKNNFLLSFVIVDEMTDMVYVMYDGHVAFEHLPFNTINRENKSHDREMQTLIRAIGKMS